MKIAIIAAALTMAAAGAAQAAERQGPWLEGRAGWDYSNPTSGLLYGAGAGYDFAIGGKGFAGVQVGINGSTLRECIGTLCATAGRDLEVLARGGFSVAERTTAYVLAGYANSRVAVTAVGVGVNQGGFRTGVGIEQGFGKNLFAKAEYRYTSYSDDGGSRNQLTASFGIRF